MALSKSNQLGFSLPKLFCCDFKESIHLIKNIYKGIEFDLIYKEAITDCFCLSSSLLNEYNIHLNKYCYKYNICKSSLFKNQSNCMPYNYVLKIGINIHSNFKIELVLENGFQNKRVVFNEEVNGSYSIYEKTVFCLRTNRSINLIFSNENIEHLIQNESIIRNILRELENNVEEYKTMITNYLFVCWYKNQIYVPMNKEINNIEFLNTLINEKTKCDCSHKRILLECRLNHVDWFHYVFDIFKKNMLFFEIGRLISYLNFTFAKKYLHLDFLKFLKNGFYFDIYSKLIKCSYCHIKLKLCNLQNNIDIESVHRQISPYCIFHNISENTSIINIKLNEDILKGLLKDYFLACQYTFIKNKEEKIIVLNPQSSNETILSSSFMTISNTFNSQDSLATTSKSLSNKSLLSLNLLQEETHNSIMSNTKWKSCSILTE